MRFAPRLELPDRWSGDSSLRVPGLRSIGCGVWTRRRPQGYADQIHEGQWEIHYLVRGMLRWQVRDEIHVVRSGDVFVAGPGERHDGIDRVLHRCEACWAGVVPGRLRGPGAAALAAGLGRLRARRFAGDAAIEAAFAVLLANARPGSDGLRREAARAACHLLVAATLRAAGTAGAGGPGPPSGAVAVAVAELRARLQRPPLLAELARRAGLAPSTLRARCVAELGLSPAELLAQLRVERAQELLRGGASCAAAAQAVGFATAQHFGAVFRRLVGSTPGAWRRGIV